MITFLNTHTHTYSYKTHGTNVTGVMVQRKTHNEKKRDVQIMDLCNEVVRRRRISLSSATFFLLGYSMKREKSQDTKTNHSLLTAGSLGRALQRKARKLNDVQWTTGQPKSKQQECKNKSKKIDKTLTRTPPLGWPLGLVVGEILARRSIFWVTIMSSYYCI